MSIRANQLMSQEVEANLHSMRQTIGRYGLSATVSIVISCSGYPAALANANVVFAPNVPVVHSVAHNVVTPATSHIPVTPQAHIHTSTTTHSTSTTTTSTSAASKFANTHKTAAPSSTANSASGSLNLSSTKADLSASLLGNFQSLTIEVGGKTDVVKMSSKLTDAEFIAAEQVLNGGASTGHQTLTVNNAGTASGGTVQLNNTMLTGLDSAVGGSVTALTIPNHVTIDDSVSSLNISGALTNKGSIVAQSLNGSPESISAYSILNSGTISGKSTELTLNSPSLTNTGTIHGASNLTINSASIVNTCGTISAPKTINIANAGGVDIKGGNILSKTLNLDAGSSALNVNGTNITGFVNDTAGDAHINATSQNFQLGVSNVKNDPLFSSTGNFTITNAVSATNGNDLSIIAGGNILSSAGGTLDTSTTGAANAGNITLVAGANFTIDANNNLTVVQSTTAGGGSATGGSINLTGSLAGGAPISQINASSAQQQGGNVTLVAYAGSTVGSGSVLLPTSSTINTNGGTGGGAGSINVIAGGTTGTSISLGNISASSGAASNVNISAAHPIASNLTIASNGSISTGSFSADPLNVQAANISVGNINAQGGSFGQVVINSGGTVTFKNIDTSGYGGAVTSYASPTGAAGHDAQTIAITAGKGISGGNVLAYGGGGAGGAGSTDNNFLPGRDGGSGGAGANVLLSTTTGNIAISGMVNNSGGGGGGGGAGGAQAPGGDAGLGGSNGQLTITATSGTLNVSQGIYSVSGTGGGFGGTTPGTSTTSIGGGGGGSFGGGGGAGGSSVASSGNASAGSGGGGGYYGGGGAGVSGNDTSGGGGGGAGSGGQSPAGSPANAGTFMNGGTGLYSGLLPGAGGTFGVGGAVGTNSTSTDQSAGGTVITNDGVPVHFAVNLTGGAGIGTALAPLNIVGGTEVLSAGSGSIYINSRTSTTFDVLAISAAGTLSLQSSGSMSLSGNAANGLDAATINLTTTPTVAVSQVGSGGISIASDISATKAISMNAGGFGSISDGEIISTPTLSVTTSNGTANLSDTQSTYASLQFELGGVGVSSFQDASSLKVLGSDGNHPTSIVNIVSNQGKITVAGAVSVGSTLSLSGQTGVALQSQISANQIILVAQSGTITSTVPITANSAITLTSNQSGLGALTVNAPTVTITAPSGTITDTYTGDTGFFATGNVSPHGVLVFNSAGSELTVGANAISNFGTVSLTASAGGLSLANNAITANTAINLTAADDIIASSTGNTLTAPTVTFKTTSGNIEGLDGSGFGLNAQNLNVTGSAAFTLVNLNSMANTTVNLSGVTANNFTFAGNDGSVNIAGKIAATNISISSDFNITQTTATGILSGTTIALNADGNVGSNLSPAGMTIALSGGGNEIDLIASNAAIQSTGAITLGASNVSTDLAVKSTLGINQLRLVQVGSQAILNGTTFTQFVSGDLEGGTYAITATKGTTTSALFNGVVNASGLTVIAPAAGTITVGSGAAIDATNVSMQASTITLAGTGATAGTIQTSINPLNAVGTISFSGPAGASAFVLNGGGTIGASQNLNISSTNNLTIGNGIQFVAPATNEKLTATGILNLPANTLSVAPDASGNGGTINVSAASIQVNGVAVNATTNTLTFNASVNNPFSTSNTGDGGTINLTLTGAGAVTAGNAGQYLFNDPNGEGGATSGIISITTGGALTVDPSAGFLSNSNLGFGDTSLVAKGNLIVKGNFDTRPITGTAGSIFLSSGSATPFTVNTTAAPTNGVGGYLAGVNVTIVDTAGVTFGNLVNGPAATASGALTLNTNNVLFNNTAGNANISANSLAVSGGALAFTGVTSNSFGAVGPNNVSLTGTSFAAPIQLIGSANTNLQNASLIASGVLTLPTSSISVSGANSGITISAGSQKFAAGVVGPLSLASDTAVNNAINYTLGGTTAINIGGPNANLLISAQNVANTNTINVKAGGAITDNSGGLTDGGNFNNNISFISTGSTALIKQAAIGDLNFNSLTLQSNSATPLTLGLGTATSLTNGIETQSGNTISGINLTFANTGGAVVINNELSGTASSITAKGDITSNVTASVSIQDKAVTLLSTAGNIGKNGQLLIQTSANNAHVTLGTGLASGVINVKDEISSALFETLTALSTGASFTFASNGGLTVNSQITAANVSLTSGSNGLFLSGDVGNGTGTITLNTTGTLTQTSGNISAKTLTFNASNVNGTLATNATSILGSGVSAAGSMNILDSATGVVSLSGLSAGGNITFVTGGGISIAGAIGSGATNSTTLLAGGTGSITATNATNAINGLSVNLSGVNIGSATQALLVNSNTLNISSTGLDNVANNSSNSGLTLGDVSGLTTSFTLTNNGSINLGSINSTGKVTISDISTTGTGGISTRGFTAINTPASITLQSSNADQNNQIEVGGNLFAPTVTLINTGAAATNGIALSGDVGNSATAGVVTLNTAGAITDTGAINQPQVIGKTFNFNATTIGDVNDPLGIVSTAINQTAPNTSAGGVFLYDIGVKPVTVSSISGVGVVLITTTAGGTFGPITGPASLGVTLSSTNAGNINLTGTIGDTTLGGNTSITIIGGGNITTSNGAKIEGGTVTLQIGGQTGNIGSATSGVSIVSNNITLQAPGSINVSNNVTGNSVILTDIGSRSISFQNTEATNGAFTIFSASATSNGGGAINISSNSAIFVGSSSIGGLEANGPISISSTGTAAGDINVAVGSFVTSHNGGVSIQTGGGTANLIVGASASISSANGNINLASAGGNVEIGDGVSLTAHNFGNITVSSILGNLTGDGALTATADKGDISLSGANAMTLGSNENGATQLTSTNGGIILTSNGPLNVINQTTFQAGGNIFINGSVGVFLGNGQNNNASNVDITSVNITDPSKAGIQIFGGNVSLGGGNNTQDMALSTNGNIIITSTAANGEVVITSNGAQSTGPQHEISAVGTGTSGGNVVIAAQGTGSTVNIGDFVTLTAQGNSSHTGIVSVLANEGDGSSGEAVSTVTFGQGTLVNYNGGLAISSSGDLTFGASDKITATPGSYGAVNLTSTHGAISVSDKNSWVTRGTVNLNANTTITYGPSVNTSFGDSLTTTNGNINFSALGTGVNSTTPFVAIGYGATIEAISAFSNLGDVSFSAGAGNNPANVPISTFGYPGVSVNGANIDTTAVGFSSNGTVQFITSNAAISVNNQGSQSNFSFFGNNFIEADPPIGAPVAPQWMVTGALPTTLNMPTSNFSNNTSTTIFGTTLLQTVPESKNLVGISPLLSTRNIDIIPFSGISTIGRLATLQQPVDALSNVQTVGVLQQANAIDIAQFAGTTSSAQNAISASNTNIATGTTSQANIPLFGGISKKGSGAFATKQLENGAMLIAPERSTVVTTRFGNVQVADKAVALVVATDKGLSVYNLDDSRHDSVIMSINGERLSLTPGRHITVTHDNTRSFAEVNPAAYVGYRNLRSYKLNGEFKAYQSEFNHMSVVAGLEPLQNMLKSNSQTTRKLGQHMFKTAALLNMMNVNPTPFETMSAAPSVTAMK